MEAPSRRELRQYLMDAGLSSEMADWLVMNVRLEDGRARWTFDRRALDRLQATTSDEDLWDVIEQRRAVTEVRDHAFDERIDIDAGSLDRLCRRHRVASLAASLTMAADSSSSVSSSAGVVASGST